MLACVALAAWWLRQLTRSIPVDGGWALNRMNPIHARTLPGCNRISRKAHHARLATYNSTWRRAQRMPALAKRASLARIFEAMQRTL